MNIYVYAASMLFTYMVSLFFLALYKKDNSIVDIGWGVGFIVLALFSLCYTGLYLPRQLITTLLVIIWGIRISLHIGVRHKGEDIRYVNWRTTWGEWFALRSFFQIFMLQGAILFIIAYPILLINSSDQSGFTLFDLLGIAIWAIGFIFEAVGDYQLALFLRDEHNRGRVMSKGLWKYTRHPNYFGEALIWWGFFCIACSVPYGITTIISPLLITFLLRYVSGVPLIEEIFANNREYEAYKDATSPFFPWFPFTDEDIA